MRIVVTVVVALLTIGVLAVITTFPGLYVAARRATYQSEAATADLCAMQLDTAEAFTHETLETLRGRYDLLAITVRDPRLGTTMSAGSVSGQSSHAENRVVQGLEVTVSSSRRNLDHAERTLRILVWAAAATSAAALILIAVSVVAAFGRAERGPANHGLRPPSGDSYLMETFQTSIRTLKHRESELRQAHGQEKERADKLDAISSTLVRSLTSGFLAIDEQGRLLDLNRPARDLLGLPDSLHVRGRHVTAALEKTAFASELVEAVDQHKALIRREIEREDGRVFDLTTVPVLDDDDRYSGMLALITDLTPIRRLETRLREMRSLADLGEMSAGIAHEFRNSLSAVLGYIRLVRKESLAPGVDQRLARAEEEGRSLNEAVEKLLVFSRPMQLQLSEIDLWSFVEGNVSGFRELHPHIRFCLTGSSSVRIEGDAALLWRTLENVLRNSVEAIEAKGGGGTVTVTISRIPDPGLEIADDGVGVDEDDAQNLLLPFRSTKPGGFGLGLSLARKVMVLHGGTLELRGDPALAPW